jgi:hypothetical protein
MNIGKIKLGDFEGISFYNFNVKKDSKFVITSYWWGRGNINRNSRKGVTYDALADRLIKDCEKTGCNYIIVEVPSFAVPGGYQKAINFKPAFINYILDFIPTSFERAVYIDTDMSIHKHPYLFDMPGYDFMGYNWNWEVRQMFNIFPTDCWDPYNLHTSGGLLMFSKSEPSRELLNKWNLFVQKYPGKAEDRMLSIPFNDEMFITKLRCFWLPNEYFWLPYFYEYSDEFYVDKKYQKEFKKEGIKFKKDTTDEINFKDFYNVQKRDIIISHPEMLTSEEMAAKQGADLNRIPLEWFKSQGRKKRCLTDFNKLVYNSTLIVEGKQAQKQMEPSWMWLKTAKFVKTEDKKIEFNKIKLKVVSDRISSDNNLLILTIYQPNGKKEKEQKNRWIQVMKELNLNYIVIKGDESVNFATVIYNTMKRFKKDILFLSIDSQILEKFVDDDINLSEIDFACSNVNAFPGSYLHYERCDDPRILNCPIDNILYFKNNKFGKDILKAWNITKEGENETQNLSIAFNKYSLITQSRVHYFDPGYTYNPKILTTKGKKFVQRIIIRKTTLPSGEVDLYDFLKQCGEKRAVSLKYESAYKTHYTPSKYKVKK